MGEAKLNRKLGRTNPKKPAVPLKKEDRSELEKFVCVRVCSNGEAKFTVRDKEGMESWLGYNLEDRWGQALFINGEYKGGGKGYFKEGRVEIIASKLKDNLKEDMRKPIVQLRVQPEYFGGVDLGTRMRYDDDLYYRERFS